MTRVALTDAAEIIMGQSPPSSSYNEGGTGIPFFQGKTDFGDIYPKTRLYCDAPAKIAHKNDILISVRAPVGPTNLAPFTCCLGRGLSAIRAKRDTDYLYLFRFMRFYAPELEKAGKGSTFESITRDDFAEIFLPLPSLEEQRRIAGILERADRLRRLRLQALEISDTYLQSVFLEMFGNEQNDRTTMSEVLSKAKNSIRTGPFGSQLLHSEFVDAGVAVLGIDNAVQNRFVWAKPRFITPKKYEEMKRYTVYPKDIIVTIMGTVGRCAIVPDMIPESINSKHLCCMTLNLEQFAPEFIHACFLHHPPLLKQLKDTQRGAIMDGLNMELIKSLEIPLPPLELQRKFARVVQRHERLRAQQLEGVRLAQGLYDALLHDAFADA